MPVGEWTTTKHICLSSKLVYPGDRSANHNLAYPPLKELVAANLVEKRMRPKGHRRYTEYRRKA